MYNGKNVKLLYIEYTKNKELSYQYNSHSSKHRLKCKKKKTEMKSN